MPVLCEKPLAADVADAEAIVAACAGGLAGTAFDQRFHPAHRRIAEIVAAGELGTVTAVRIVYACWLPPDWSPDGAPHDNWRVDPARAGGGALVDLAPHGIDLVGALLGGDDLTSCTSSLQRRVHDYPVDDGARARRPHRGRRRVLRARRLQHPRRAAAPPPRGRRHPGPARRRGHDGPDRGRPAHAVRRRRPAADVPFDTATSPFAAQLAAFSAAVAGTAAWPWPLERDLRLHRLLHAAIERS